MAGKNSTNFGSGDAAYFLAHHTRMAPQNTLVVEVNLLAHVDGLASVEAVEFAIAMALAVADAAEHDAFAATGELVRGACCRPVLPPTFAEALADHCTLKAP